MMAHKKILSKNKFIYQPLHVLNKYTNFLATFLTFMRDTTLESTPTPISEI